MSQKLPLIEDILLYGGIILIILSVLIMLNKQGFFTVGISNKELSKYLQAFVLDRYSYRNGKYNLTLRPSQRMFVKRVSVNGRVFDNLTGEFTQWDVIQLEGFANTEELYVEIIYSSGGLPHKGFARLPQTGAK